MDCPTKSHDVLRAGPLDFDGMDSQRRALRIRIREGHASARVTHPRGSRIREGHASARVTDARGSRVRRRGTGQGIRTRDPAPLLANVSGDGLRRYDVYSRPRSGRARKIYGVSPIPWLGCLFVNQWILRNFYSDTALETLDDSGII
jgi:hypothetical protein